MSSEKITKDMVNGNVGPFPFRHGVLKLVFEFTKATYWRALLYSLKDDWPIPEPTSAQSLTDDERTFYRDVQVSEETCEKFETQINPAKMITMSRWNMAKAVCVRELMLLRRERAHETNTASEEGVPNLADALLRAKGELAEFEHSQQHWEYIIRFSRELNVLCFVENTLLLSFNWLFLESVSHSAMNATCMLCMYCACYPGQRTKWGGLALFYQQRADEYMVRISCIRQGLQLLNLGIDVNGLYEKIRAYNVSRLNGTWSQHVTSITNKWKPLASLEEVVGRLAHDWIMNPINHRAPTTFYNSCLPPDAPNIWLQRMFSLLNDKLDSFTEELD